MKKIKNFLKRLGPGFITGASDDDPSGIVTYSQTGALFGFGQAWTSLFSFPLMAVVQEMCGRIGLVSGKGLAAVIKQNYSKRILYISVSLLLLANTINIGADLGAMAAVANLIFGLPFFFWLFFIVLVTLSLEIFISYKTYSKYLKYLTFALFSYVLSVFVIKINWLDVLKSTLIPHFEFSKVYVLNIIAILGTTISPYLFFWQADEEVEEEVAYGKLRSLGAGIPRLADSDISKLRIDTISGMFFSNLIMFFIIVTSGAVLYANGIHSINSASQAALALRPIAGDFAFLLFALGIIGAGFLAVPILAGSASYAVSETFGWRAGLNKKFTKAPGFYGIIIIATFFGLFINFLGIDPIVTLYYTAVINGIIAPPLLLIILLIANNKKIMGEKVNNKLSNVFVIFTILIMGLSSLGLLFTSFFK